MSTTVSTQSPYQLARWKVFMTDDSHQDRFIYFLAPIMEHVYQTCLQQIHASHHLARLFSDDFLLATLIKQYKTVFSPMFLKCGLWELHVAKDNNTLPEGTPEQRFNWYIESMSSQEFIPYFLEKYPPLQTLLDNRVATLMHSWQLFLTRLDADWPTINEAFIHLDNCHLADMSVSGDTHCLGLNVIKLTFKQEATKQVLIYKPRNMDIDLAYNHFIQWYNTHNELKLNTFEILNKGDYGWCEFVTFLSCLSMDEIERFYQRMGVLLALLYALKGGDIHFENLIAHGEQPTIVDLECLIKPKLDIDYFEPPPSVLDTLLLPTRINIEDEVEGWNIGGMAGDGGGIAKHAALKFESAGTDNMIIKRVDFKTEHDALNLPKLNDELFVDDLLAEKQVTEGFQQCYQFLMSQKATLLGTHSPLNNFYSARVRYLFRATRDYAQLLRESFHPNIMVSEADYDEHFSWLNDILNSRPMYEAVIPSELQDLAYGDIPYFSYDPITNTIRNSQDEKVDIDIKIQGFEFLKEQIESLCEEDLYRQTQLIRSSYSTHRLNENTNKAPEPISQDTLTIKHHKNITQKSLEACDKVLSHIVKHTFSYKGVITWPSTTVNLRKHSKALMTKFLDDTFLIGDLGIAFVMSHAAHLLKNTDYQSLVNKYMDFYLQAQNRSKNIVPQFSIFERSARIYSHHLFNALGNTIPEAITEHNLTDIEKSIEEDECYDVINGVGAFLLICDDTALLTKALDHFFAGYPEPINFPETSPLRRPASEADIYVRDNAAPVGFGHGVSGLIVALSRAQRYVNDTRIDTWIQKSLDYLDQLYDQHGFWPDTRHPEPKRGPLWCYGATGVAEAYLCLQKIKPSEQIERGLQRAIKELDNAREYLLQHHRGHYCCGYLSVHNFMINAHVKRPDLITAKRLAEENDFVLSYIEQFGYNGFTIAGDLNFSILYGLSGLCYALLRMADNTLPSIMTFE